MVWNRFLIQNLLECWQNGFQLTMVLYVNFEKRLNKSFTMTTLSRIFNWSSLQINWNDWHILFIANHFQNNFLNKAFSFHKKNTYNTTTHYWVTSVSSSLKIHSRIYCIEDIIRDWKVGWFLKDLCQAYFLRSPFHFTILSSSWEINYHKM